MANEYEGGIKPKRQETTDDIVEAALNRGDRTRRRADIKEETSTRTSSKKFASIEENVFYKTIFAEGDPEAKRAAVARELAYNLEDEKAENKNSLAEFELFKEWLMEQRKDMAQEIIKLTDTDAFSELKDVFDEMNLGLLDFENQMSPLTDILDAVYALRLASDGAMFDVFKEIQDDKAEEERVAELRNRQDSKLTELNDEVERMHGETDVLRQQKSWFGLRGTKKSALVKIERIQRDMKEKKTTIDQLVTEIENTRVDRESRFSQFAEEKQKLRELLDISSEEHKARQQSLVDSANSFVNTADTRTGDVLAHLEGINDQVDRLADSNSGLRGVYAIISEAVEEAEAVNVRVRDSLLDGPADESNIAKMKRENNKMAVENHVTAMTAAKVDTVGTFGDLTAESYRIKAMKDSNSGQVSRTRSLNSKGVAGVASRLSTVLQGVAMAALTESSEVAQMTLERMNDQTNRMAQKEAIKNAMGISLENDSLIKAIEELESYGKVARAATDISREGYMEMKDHLAELEKTAHEVGEAVKEAVAVGADVMQRPDADTDTDRDRPDDGSDGGSDDNGSPFNKLNI
jgi:hypothetical protein